MPLENFPLLKDNTRLIKYQDTLYKVKIKYPLKTKFSNHLNQSVAHKEIEQTFRAVLYLNERNRPLKTIATTYFMIKPLKRPWSFPKKCSNYSFQQNGKTLKVFDQMFELHVNPRELNKSKYGKNAKDTDMSQSNRIWNTRKCTDLKNETVSAKGTVDIVKESGSRVVTRFGRRKDGQLYRVCPKVTDENNQGEVKISGSQEWKQSLKVKVDYLKRKSVDNPHDHRKDKAANNESKQEVNRIDTKATGDSKKGRSNELKDLSNKEFSKAKQKDGRPESNRQRDKFSLRLCELRDMKQENVQPKRLRNRNSDSIGVKNKTQTQSHSRSDIEQTTDSEVSQSEDTNETKTLKRLQVDQEKHQHKRLKSLRKRTRGIDSSSECKLKTDVNVGTSNREERQEDKIEERIVNYRSLRSRHSEVHRDSSSQLDCQQGQQSNSDSENLTLENVDIENKFFSPRVAGKRISRRGKRGTGIVTNQIEKSYGKKQRENINSVRLEKRGSLRNQGKKMKRKDKMGDGKELVKSQRDTSSSSLSSREVQSLSQSSCNDTDSWQSPRKSRRLEEKPEVKTDATNYNKNTNSVSSSQQSSRSRKIKLYASSHSPQVVSDAGSKPIAEVSSPRVSTVLPVKRSQISMQPPDTFPARITRQSIHVHDEELRRIEGLREERPSHIYRDIMLATGRDRYLVEQAENAETDKLQQLYQPTVPNQSESGRNMATKRRRSSGLWGKFMDTLVTPTKKYMFGKRKLGHS